MKKQFASVAFLILAGAFCPCQKDCLQAAGTAIIVSPDGSPLERLAAKEIRRYVYLRTNRLLSIVNSVPRSGDAVVVAKSSRPIVLRVAKKQLDPASQQYLLKTVNHKGRKLLLVTGGTETATLYAAYRFAEHLGVRFYLHGDTVPDRKIPWRLPDLNENRSPLFRLRGIQPFHDFPEGPDWWTLEGYKAVLSQLPKLGMNFLGLHTYPEGGVGPEPTVWIGIEEDVKPNGNVTFSYPARHFTTHNGTWGYRPKDTGDYAFGASAMYTRDRYGNNYMKRNSPWPSTPSSCNELFNRMGHFLHEAFAFAKHLGIKTCIGTETPLTIPKKVQKRLRKADKDPSEPEVVRAVYEGMFKRIMNSHCLDYYWFWTPEGWTWRGAKSTQVEATISDIRAAIDAARNVDAPFTLATCGWVLGPPEDRALFDKILPEQMPMSCINREVGFAFVEKAFRKIKDRPKWAIPWLEDDPALIIPQLWVGRMRRDAADALAYGCTGLLGIHWRTRVLGPNVSALARAAWDQSGWNPQPGGKSPRKQKKREGYKGGSTAHFPSNPIAGTENDPLYQAVRYNMDAYRLKVPNGSYTVTLKFCEPHYNEKGKRVFGVQLQGTQVISGLDVFARVGKNHVLDREFKNVKVTEGILNIEFVKEIEYPCIAAISVQGKAAEPGQKGRKSLSRKINCGGSEYQSYQADLKPIGPYSRPRDLPAAGFYSDWAKTQFGPEAAEEIAEIFTALDGFPPGYAGERKANLPRPSKWVGGPGGISPDNRPWKVVKKDYGFVQRLAELKSRIRGTGNLQRFNYWLNTFRYLREVGKLNCIWARFNSALKEAKSEKKPEAAKKKAREKVLPIRKELVSQVAKVHKYLLATVTTTGSMGTVTNWQQHIMPSLLEKPGRVLAALLEEDLPPSALPSKEYPGPARLFVPEVRTSLGGSEPLKLKVIVLGAEVKKAKLRWKPLGKGSFSNKPLVHKARGVYNAFIPSSEIEGDFEYCVEVTTAKNRTLRYPKTAPSLNQTVVIMPGF